MAGDSAIVGQICHAFIESDSLKNHREENDGTQNRTTLQNLSQWSASTEECFLNHSARHVRPAGSQRRQQIDFLAHLRRASPPEYQNTLSDLFEKIILYDLEAQQASWRKRVDGNYEVRLKVKAKKLLTGGNGQESEMPIHDWIEIRVVGKDGRSLHAAKHLIDNSQKELTIIVPGKPEQAGIDPWFILMDRNWENNMVHVKHLESNEPGLRRN